MKILHIHTAMTGGGIQSMVCALANEMYRQGYDTTVCSIIEPTEDAVFWNKLSEGVNKSHLAKKSGGFSIEILFKIYNYIKNGRFDIVNIHGFFCYYFIAVILLHGRTKFFYTVHSDAYKESGIWDRRLFKLKKWCFKHRWLHPITISQISKDSFTQMYDCDSALIYNGIPKPQVANKDIPLINNAHITAKTKLFLHAGRIDTPKNQLVLCKVFKRLISEEHDVALIIAGANGNDRIFSEIKPYFGSRITYIGERSDIPQLMNKCDAMCLPSLYEGLPIVLLESMAVGCIPICSPVGGIPNVITDKIDGFISDSSSEIDYYNKMIEFLEQDEKELSRIKASTVRRFEDFEISKTVNYYIEEYSKK